MNKLHHSVADWDIIKISSWLPHGAWILDLSDFVSPPSCLRIDANDFWGAGYALSNLPLAQDLKAGRIVTWHRRMQVGTGRSTVFVGVTGIGDLGIHYSLAPLSDTWKKTRFSWWQGYDSHNDRATLTELEWWDVDHWSSFGISENPPLTGNINRCGIGATVQSLSAKKYFDDTEIWIPA